MLVSTCAAGFAPASSSDWYFWTNLNQNRMKWSVHFHSGGARFRPGTGGPVAGHQAQGL